jgi:hypothetical protein
MRPKDEQQLFDEANAGRELKLASCEEFAKALNQSYDPIANAMKRFPGLTREKAEEMAAAFGF